MARGIDFEIANAYAPTRFTEAEIDGFLALDPVDYELYQHRLYHLADEGKQAMEKLACTTIIRDCGEVMYGIYTAEGETVLSSTGIFLHVASLGIAVKYIRKHYLDDPSVGVRPGDQFFNNNPFYGGTHNPDQAMLKPIFHDGEIVAWIGCLTHTAPIGAVDPGGMPARAKTKFDEGLRVPIVKIVENDLLKTDIENWLTDHSEAPDHLLLDLRARLAGTHRGERRIKEIIADFGIDFMKKANRRMIYETAQHGREKILAINPGTYRQRHFYDGYGAGERQLWKVSLDVTVKDGEMTLDFNDSSPRHPGPYNMPPTATLGGIQSGLCPNLLWDVVWNDGIWDFVHVRLPEAGTSIMSADSFAAINHCVLLAEAVGEFVRLATGKMMYDSPHRLDLNASWAASSAAPYFGGVNQFGKPFGSMDLNLMGCGTGARCDSDGIDTGGQGWAPSSSCADVESWEYEAPLVALIRNNMIDSGGCGKYRGGVSKLEAWVVRNAPEGILLGSAGMSDRFHPSFGLFGGYAAACVKPFLIQDTNFEQLVRAGEHGGDLPFYDMDDLLQAVEDGRLTGTVTPVAPSFAPVIAKDGDICVWPMTNTSAGGGYGDCLERDPDLVMQDLRTGITSAWTAREIYRVAYDPATFIVDDKATRQLRQEAREERIRSGMTFDGFEAARRDRRPAEEILGGFGPWPNERAASASANGASRSAGGTAPSRAGNADELRAITEYLALDLDAETWSCRSCGASLGGARANYKEFCLIRERVPAEVYPPKWGYAADSDWCTVREFYCPHCGVMMDVTYQPPGYPIVHDIELDLDAMKQLERADGPGGPGSPPTRTTAAV